MNWDEYFIGMADYVSTKSKDRSTKIGCVIVGPNHEIRTTGYNGFCRGIDDEVNERHDRPTKYLWTEHAERNAIYNAARNGIRLEDCIAYVNGIPCADCTRGLIQSGVKKIVYPDISKQTTKMPIDTYRAAIEMMNEAGIEQLVY